jgi:hypothetical protein
MGDNGFSTWFRDFAVETVYAVWGNPNASPLRSADAQAQSATESAAITSDTAGASELPHVHEWLRPDNGVIECASCGATRWHYGD